MCCINTNVLFTKSLALIFLLNIHVKKINYFVFIVHQVNKHGVSRRWFTEADVKDFKSGALRTTTDIIKTGFELSLLSS